jgi:hypothetical protein
MRLKWVGESALIRFGNLLLHFVDSAVCLIQIVKNCGEKASFHMPQQEKLIGQREH